QIGMIVGKPKAYGVEVVDYDPVARRWTIKCGSQTIRLDEVGGAARTPEPKGRRAKKPPSEAEVAEHLRQVAVARLGQRAQNEQVGALAEDATVAGHVKHLFRRLVLGHGPAGAMDSN